MFENSIRCQKETKEKYLKQSWCGSINNCKLSIWIGAGVKGVTSLHSSSSLSCVKSLAGNKMKQGGHFFAIKCIFEKKKEGNFNQKAKHTRVSWVSSSILPFFRRRKENTQKNTSRERKNKNADVWCVIEMKVCHTTLTEHPIGYVTMVLTQDFN